MEENLSLFAQQGFRLLQEEDPQLYSLLDQEYQRQQYVLSMVAASSIADPSVLVCEGTSASNITTEGHPGLRFHGGCEFADKIENIAIERAKKAFKAQYANVQPHSGTSANEIVLFSLLQPGDTFMGLELNAGGHLTHGANASVAGRYFRAIGYGLTPEGFLDYPRIADLAHEYRPRLIICGASAYPRKIDFERFRTIANDVGAFLLADISHIAGLVVSGVHASPIDHAHFTTTSTYKQLYGPRGGLILIGKDASLPAPDQKRTLAEMIQRAVFPFFQGTPHINTIAAKARAFALIMQDSFTQLARDILTNAQALAAQLQARGYTVLTGGTDTHMVLIDVRSHNLTGVIVEKALERCSIIVNKNRIAGDQYSAHISSGIRLGTNSLTLRGMGPTEMAYCAEIIHRVLCAITVSTLSDYELLPAVEEEVRQCVYDLCSQFPIPHYPYSAAPNVI